MREGAQGNGGSKRVRGGTQALGIGLALLGALGCSNTPAPNEAETRVAVRAEAPKPEQVVQLALPAPGARRIEPAANANAASNENTSAGATAAPSAVPVPQKADDKKAPQRITSKHIEDELNRLEAELK